MSEAYLIWSKGHGAWRRPDGHGYTPRLSEASRYSHEVALDMCARAIPGNARRAGALHELPVRQSDVAQLVRRFDNAFPKREWPEPWE